MKSSDLRFHAGKVFPNPKKSLTNVKVCVPRLKAELTKTIDVLLGCSALVIIPGTSSFPVLPLYLLEEIFHCWNKWIKVLKVMFWGNSDTVLCRKVSGNCDVYLLLLSAFFKHCRSSQVPVGGK